MIEIFENGARETDVEVISDLLQLINPNLKRVDLERLEAVMKDGFIFLARDDEVGGKVIGMATLVPMIKLAGYFGNVEDVVVSEEYRGQGIGKRLMEKIVEKANELEMGHLFLTSNKKREAARNMYRSFGFEEYETTPFKLILDL